MGIKGIYGQIGPGERIALAKLAVEHFEKHGRPLRLAVDASIWHFQTQAGQGGSNPALRTLYYRLIRLLSLSIKPLFVFDGPNKPPFKRNVKTGNLGSQLPNFITKQILDLFGFPYHTAPGEAEAECALLQKEGVVDAVLSEDVDTMMFGCTVHLRNWSSENVRGNKSPTHVNVYRAEATKRGKSGLDSDGMILVALMSGGDYIPAGVPKCGIKIACEAANAGFGRDLCQILSKDAVGFNQWRERLQYELHVNESGFFRSRHKALMIPENFPDKKVLRYYTHPAVSTSQQVGHLREEIRWDQEADVPGLRRFVAEAFEWRCVSGARKFLRTLAPAMLVDQLCRRYNKEYPDDNSGRQQKEESELVAMVCARRSHWITDGLPELRIIYTPLEAVGLDMDAEDPDVELAALSESETELQDEDNGERSRSPSKRSTSRYDPTQPEKIWVLESYVKFGIPLMVENWEESMRDPKKFASRKARERAAGKKKPETSGIMKPGAMDAFVKTMKPSIDRGKPVPRPELPQKSLSASMTDHRSPPKTDSGHRDTKTLHTGGRSAPSTPKKKVLARSYISNLQRTSPSSHQNINPWTLAKRPSDTLNTKLPPGTRFPALGIYEPLSSETSPKNDPQVDDRANPDSPQPLTSTCSGSRQRRNISDASQGDPPGDLSTKGPNRILDFAAETSPDSQERPLTITSLPSLSQLMIPSSVNSPDRACVSSMPDFIVTGGKIKDTKRARALLALRESLNGTWRDIQPWERDRPYIKTTYEHVEIIDLTKT
ncbi:MAG: hypothetical protein Q9219_001656 [cf. Caloplaca sp. 3 TL-2023]